MNRADVLELLHEGEVTIEFVKKNGEWRQMRATLNEHLLPDAPTPADHGKKTRSDESLPVWDLDKGAFRSFRWDALTRVDDRPYFDETRPLARETAEVH